MSDVLVPSISAVGRVLGIGSIGAVCAVFPRSNPLLGPDKRKAISQLSMTLFFPALVLHSLGTIVSVEILAEVWPLFLFSMLTILVSTGASLLVAHILGLKGAYRRIYVIAGAFGNNVSLPLLVSSALCERPMLKGPYGDKCKAMAYGFCMLHSLPWRFAFFGIGMPWVKRSTEDAEDEIELELVARRHESAIPPSLGIASAAGEQIDVRDLHDDLVNIQLSHRSLSAHFHRMDTTVNNIEISPPSPKSLKSEEGSGSPPQRRDSTLAVGLLHTITTDPGAVDINKVEEEEGTACQHAWKSTRRFLTGFVDFNIAATTLGVVIGIIPPLQKFLLGNVDELPTMPVLGESVSTLSEPAVALATLLLGAALVPKQFKMDDYFNRTVISQVAGLLVIRFAIIPVLIFASVFFTYDHLPGNTLMWLLILIECAVPSAQLAIICVSALGRHELAASLAPVYLVQYLLCSLTSTAWTAGTLKMLEALDPEFSFSGLVPMQPEAV
ncbi:hypothetical protein DIPPA_30336 [Diplonema papillatum]|nr:hypothetical protein DIPPA_30336 [Diplonema papillatum]|eukprot:gene6261-9598_t